MTFEGQKSDWEKLLARLDKLATFGEEPKAFAFILRPILSRFVSAFTVGSATHTVGALDRLTSVDGSPHFAYGIAKANEWDQQQELSTI